MVTGVGDGESTENRLLDFGLGVVGWWIFVLWFQRRNLWEGIPWISSKRCEEVWERDRERNGSQPVSSEGNYGGSWV